ncbi:hypothetical protein BS47DRAFT_1344152 [Hydnum rufescens UP504]|uniref:Bromodomain associated domain-containing protein n=1 Tax=Hydnum rufescens UP504 TaxID=1448309 RepID=A0A9P6DWA8_9AGAM|nr:hypothetical protein BS47DRAFT_1344152 [Hydnum rufescens UP504]
MSSQAFVEMHLRRLVRQVVHANNFTKASSKALDIVVHLLGHYLELLAAKCALFAQHTGRDGVNIHDALMALEESGMDVEDIMGWCGRDGVELSKFGPGSLREGFEQFSAILTEGAKMDKTDAVLLTYQRLPSPPPNSLYGELENDNYEESVSSPSQSTHINGAMSSPVLPLSPVSNPAQIAPIPPRERKRRRPSDWASIPPEHVPIFLPPFPGHEAPQSPEPIQAEDTHMHYFKVLPPTSDSPPLGAPLPSPPPLPPPAPPVPLSVASYLEEVPYETSTLSTTPDHMPRPPDRLPEPEQPSAHPYLLVAMQTAHDHSNAGNANPGRLAISTALSIMAAPRYSASDALFSVSIPPPPRTLAPSPSYATPLNPDVMPNPSFPPTPSRSIQSPLVPMTILPQYLQPHLQTLSERIVKQGVHDRSTRVAPPPPFVDNGQPRLHGRPVRAPWNASPGVLVHPDKPPVLADALLYTTWDYPQKNFEERLKKKSTNATAGLTSTGNVAEGAGLL